MVHQSDADACLNSRSLFHYTGAPGQAPGYAPL